MPEVQGWSPVHRLISGDCAGRAIGIDNVIIGASLRET